MRFVVLVLLLLTLYLQYALWFTRGGVRDVDKLRQSVVDQKDEIARLQERNRALSAEVIDLKQGLDAIEERARTEMGMIKRGEVFFRMTDPKQAGTNAPAITAAPSPEPPLEPPLDPLVAGAADAAAPVAPAASAPAMAAGPPTAQPR